ncbi:transporter substrate-binding domain-containing protein, partial [Roseibium sp. SCP14]
AVLNELGIQNVEAVVVDYGAMIPGLLAGRFDMVAAGLYIKPERCQAVVFSEPDVCDAEAFAVKAGNPKGLNNYA